MQFILFGLLFWAFYGRYVVYLYKLPLAEKRFNVLGALDAITYELITVTDDSYINAQSVCDLL